MIAILAVDAPEWEESKHKRDEGGKFAVSAGTKFTLESQGFKNKPGEPEHHFHHHSGAMVSVHPLKGGGEKFNTYKHGFPVGAGTDPNQPAHHAMEMALKDAAEKAHSINDFILKAAANYPKLSNQEIAGLAKAHFKSNTTDKSVASVKSVAKKKAAAVAAVSALPPGTPQGDAENYIAMLSALDGFGYTYDGELSDSKDLYKIAGSHEDKVLVNKKTGAWEMASGFTGATAGSLIAHLNGEPPAVSPDQKAQNTATFDAFYKAGFSVETKDEAGGVNHVTQGSGPGAVKGWYAWAGSHAGQWEVTTPDGTFGGVGADALKAKLAQLAKPPQGTKSQASVPYAMKTGAGKAVADALAGVGYELDKSTPGKVLYKKGDAYVEFDAEGKWIAQTPGKPSKTGTGGESLAALLSGAKSKDITGVSSTQTQIGPQVGPQPAPEIKTPASEQLRQKIAAHRPKMTAKESAALGKYKGSGYQGINKGLRHTKGFAEKSEDVKALDSLMAKAVIPFETKLYRKVGQEYSQIMKSVSFAGSVFQDRGFVSTATSQGVWSGDLHLTIHVPAGTHGVTPKSAGESDGEQEVVLARGTRFVVEEYDDHANAMTVRAVQDHLKWDAAAEEKK